MTARATQQGLTLIEFMVALVAAVLVVGALNGVVDLALRARSSGRQDHELVYQGRFALERMIARARVSTPKLLATPAVSGTTGDWFDATMYCLKAGNRLVETTVTDTLCAGTVVIADNVVAFAAQPTGYQLDDPIGTLVLTLQAGGAPLILTTSVRVGGSAP